MGQTLTNGIYLPNEGERNCYSGLAANWNAVDTLKGNYSLHAINVDIHVTAAEKEAWNGKADNSALTAHTGNTTIHVTAEDKETWNGKADASALTAHTGNTTIHVTAEDKAKWDAVTSKADDSDVVHKSGNETKSGELTVTKVLTNNLQAENTSLTLQSKGTNRSVAIYNGNSAADGGGFWCYGKDTLVGSDCRMQIYNTAKSRYERVDLINSQFLPTPSGELDCGGSSNKWKSINGINPGSLSLPDFLNAIDISSYITVTGGSVINNNYTPPADGYISVNLGRTSGAIGLIISNGKIQACVRENTLPDNHRECGGFIPVQKNDSVVITSCLADSIIWAYFIPCQGNV